MKYKISAARFIRTASLLSLIFFACLISARAAASLQPFVECVERETDGGGAYTGNLIVYFGYELSATSAVTLSYPSANNYFSPSSTTLSNPPTVFLPGVHRRVVAATIPAGTGLTWFLGTTYASVSGSADINTLLCSNDGANSRLITYQGKLSDGAQAANGKYDLQFQLFNAATGGAARTTLITLDDITVTNGIFTVQLDLGANSLPPSNTETTATNLKLNPAILDAENSFFEIGVRPGTSTGAFTTLTTRQPLTAVPLAMRANTADDAFRAVNADKLGGISSDQFVRTNDGRLSDARTPTAGSGNYIQNTTTQQTANFNVSGNGTIGGNLTVNGTISGTLPGGSGSYIQNTTTQQPNTNFNISGGGTVGGTLTANTLTADSASSYILNANSSSSAGTWLTLNNTTTGGRNWSVISTGASNGEGAGKLLLRDSTNEVVRLTLSDAGASVNGNLTVSGTINGTATNATNATNVSGGFVQLPLTNGAPPATECDEAAEYGRQKVDAGSVRLYICTAAGWKFTALQ